MVFRFVMVSVRCGICVNEGGMGEGMVRTFSNQTNAQTPTSAALAVFATFGIGLWNPIIPPFKP